MQSPACGGRAQHSVRAALETTGQRGFLCAVVRTQLLSVMGWLRYRRRVRSDAPYHVYFRSRNESYFTTSAGTGTW